MTLEGHEPIQVLRPVLDTFLNNAVGITGCRSYGIERHCCEYDLLVVSNEQRSPTSVKMGAQFIDLLFTTEKDIMKPSDPEIAVSVASLQQVRDVSLILSTGTASNKAVLHENSMKSAQGRLASSLKALGRAEEAITKKSVADADFWLLSASFDYAKAWLYSLETAPAPSHVLEQLKARSKGNASRFEAFSKAAGLERASRSTCEARLESLSILYDSITAASVSGAEELRSMSTKVAFDIVKGKADYLTTSTMLVDCYSFLGLQTSSVIPAISNINAANQKLEVDPALIVATLSKGDKKMIGEQVVKGLGLGRTQKAVERGMTLLQDAVSSLAKKI